MAIKSSGPLGIDTDITREIDHIDINADGSIDLTNYYDRHIRTQVNDNLYIYYIPAGQVPGAQVDDPLPMGSSYYGVEVVYEFTYNSGFYVNLSLDALIGSSGWNRRSPVVINLGPEFLAYSNSITRPALIMDITAPFVVINLSGAVMGRGGGGGTSYSYYTGSALSLNGFYGTRYNRADGSAVRFCDGEDGGPAASITSSSQYTINILGDGWIGGGGGGGGGYYSSGLGDVSVFDDAEPRYGGGGGGAGGGRGGAIARDAGYYSLGGADGGPGQNGRAGGSIYGGSAGAGGYGPGEGGLLTEVRKKENRAGAGGGGGRNYDYSGGAVPGSNSGARASRRTGGNGGVHGQPGGNGGAGVGGRAGPSLIYDVSSTNIRFVGTRVYGPKGDKTSYDIINYPGG